MKQNTRGLSLTAGILFLILGVYLIGAVILDIITLEIHAPYAQQYVLAAFLDYLGLLAIGIGLICRSRAVVLAGSLWQAVIYALSLVSWVNWAYWQEASPAGRAAVFASAYVQGGLRNLLLFLLMFFILITLILALCRAKALKSLWLLPLIPAALCLAWSAAGPFLVSLVLALPAATLTEILAALGADLLAYILLVAMDVVLFFAVLFFCLWNRRQPAPLLTLTLKQLRARQEAFRAMGTADDLRVSRTMPAEKAFIAAAGVVLSDGEAAAETTAKATETVIAAEDAAEESVNEAEEAVDEAVNEAEEAADRVLNGAEEI